MKNHNLTTDSKVTENNIINGSGSLSGIVEIELDKLRLHPKNIRTQYEGIDELTASIKKNGILQNLTVVPDKDDAGKYVVVIGNRRLLAAKEAGLKTAPCRIMQMAESDQSVSMLTENMNRKDLKIYEEAAGTQMCLSDYGLTVDALAEMTGLSSAKIVHRANIAKLDQKALIAKESDTSFQLSIQDLEKLEKVGSVATRNKILREAKDSRDLAWKAQSAADEEKRQKTVKKFVALAKKQGIEPAPEGADREIYTNKWETVKDYSLADDVPGKLDAGEGQGVYYLVYYRTFKLVRKTKKQQKTEKSIKAKRRLAKVLYTELHEQIREFVCGMIDGRVKGMKDKAPLMQVSWEILIKNGAFVSSGAIIQTLSGKQYYEIPENERTSITARASALALHHQILAVACYSCRELELIDYNGHYAAPKAEILKKLYSCLAEYGFSFSDDAYVRFMNGTHEVYVESK